MALAALGKYEESVEAFDTALHSNPSDVWALNNKGLSLGKLGRDREAAEALGKAREMAHLKPFGRQVW